jgi:hypothetical protein
MVFSKEEWRRHLSPGAGTGIPAGVDELQRKCRSGGVELEGFGVGCPARQGDQFDLAPGWYAGQVPDSWHHFKSCSAARYFLRPISMISGSARYTATACGASFSTATKRKGSSMPVTALDSIDVERRLDVVAEVGNGAGKAAAAGIDTALEINDGFTVEPVRTTPAGEAGGWIAPERRQFGFSLLQQSGRSLVGECTARAPAQVAISSEVIRVLP